MKRFGIFLFVGSLCMFAQKNTPRHLFNAGYQTLTAASSASPRTIGDGYLRAIGAPLGWSPGDIAGTYVAKEYQTEHNGVTHLVYKQQFGGLEVFNSDFVLNIDRYGRVINAGGFLFSQSGGLIEAAQSGSAMTAVREAVTAVNPQIGAAYAPFQRESKGERRSVSFQRGALGDDIEGKAIFYALNGIIRPAWLFEVVDEDRISSYAVVVDSATGAVLEKQPLTFFQSPRGLVFTGSSPQPNPTPGMPLVAAPPYVARTMASFAGDPAASPRGWVSGNMTRGNNAVVGTNLIGTRFLPDPRTTTAPSLTFEFPLELGPGKPAPVAFADAANVNLFYWVNRAHDLFHLAGFDEPAGNYQQENYTKAGTAGDPIYAYTHFGASQPFAPLINNAFYTSRRAGHDGAQSMIAMHLGADDVVVTDGAYDAEVIVHEYAHGVSTRLVRQLAGFQGGAMGEAWSDFFALEFTLASGAPLDGIYSAGEYLFQAFGTGARNRPYTTNFEVNPLTFAQLGRVISIPQIHNDGNIWVEALWEVRANLIRQLGETEGRRKVRLLVIDGMKLSPPAPSMVDARDAILLADRIGFNGESQTQIWEGFAKRGLGVLAQSAGPDTTHVVASLDRPSSSGALKLYEERYTLGETVRAVLHDGNLKTPAATIQVTGSSGDLETLLLQKIGEVYTGSIATSSTLGVTRGDGVISLMPGDQISAYYVDQDAGGSGKLIDTTVQTQPPYSISLREPAFQASDERALNFRASFGSSLRYNLPFAFPFINQKYSSVRLFSNGLIAMDVPDFRGCTDAAALQKVNGIAPMWMALRTNGSSQPNQDIYVSRPNADAITFRWAAETEPFNPLSSPEPVNFAVTLFRDGRIQFNYGSGNRNLTNSQPILGCGISSPTIGIGNGNETFVQTVSTHSGRGTLENAPTVILDPPFNHSSIPVGILEMENGAVFRDIVTVRGIAHDAQSPVTRVDILVDGKRLVVAAPSIPRPDFCSANPVTGCPFVGFQSRLNTASAGLAPGNHTLWLRATNSRGAIVNFPDQPITFRIEPGQGDPIRGAIEEPANGSVVSTRLTLRGWAAGDALRVAGADVLVDGVTIGRAIYGVGRADVCSQMASRSPNCPNVGFSFSLNLDDSRIPLSNGRHALQVRVQDEGNRYTLIPETPILFEVDRAANQPPVGTLLTPANGQKLSGTVKITGHAYDPDGRIETVLLLINGEAREVVPYGRPRPEVCSQLQDVAACPNIGFEYDLDTRLYTNGLYSLAILAIDNKGAEIRAPSVTGNGINILIENR